MYRYGVKLFRLRCPRELIKADIAEAEKGHFRLISLHSVTAGIKYLRLGCAIIGIIEIAVLIQNLSV